MTTSAPAPSGTPRHGRRGTPRQPFRHARNHRRPILRRIAIALTALTAFVLAGGAAAYSNIQGNIHSYDITALLGDRPTSATSPDGIVGVDPGAGKAFNILVMGSDARTGAFAQSEGAVGGMRSDTTFLMHLSSDRTRVDIVNIPRDLLVNIPSCALASGGTSKAQSDAMFNSAFSIGGQADQVQYAAACTIKTVEKMTGILIDDFVVVDFGGFISTVNALGGVPICIPKDINDSQYTGLHLTAGQQVLNGEQAFLYARVRHNVDDGSDISRITRQQKLVGAMVREILAQNLLTDLPKLYRFLDAATASLTTGPTIGKIPALVGLANSVRTMQPGAVSFVTLPFDWAGPRVKPNAASAKLWAAVAADQPISTTTPTATASAPATGTATTAPGKTATSSAASPAAPSAHATTTAPPTTVPWDATTAGQADVCS